MAHFALVENNIVRQVIVVSNDDIDNLEFPESEPLGQAYIASLGLTGTWLQTSYSASFRNMYAGENCLFDANIGDYGAFVIPPVE
jgi:hypothetical protein